jgi:hypothetical protein
MVAAGFAVMEAFDRGLDRARLPDDAFAYLINDGLYDCSIFHTVN